MSGGEEAWGALGGGPFIAETHTTPPVAAGFDEMQRATDPLAWMVKHLRYKQGWGFELVSTSGWHRERSLRVRMPIIDSLTGERSLLQHQLLLPELREHHARDERYLRRMLLDAIFKIEMHEACEFFDLDGQRPFFPDHDPGTNPYAVVDKTPDQ